MTFEKMLAEIDKKRGPTTVIDPDNLRAMVEGNDIVGWYVDGRASREAFARAVNIRTRIFSETDRRFVEPEVVRYDWVRMVPAGEGGRYDLRNAKPGEEDALCITYVDFVGNLLRETRQRYKAAVESGRDEAIAWAADRLRQLGHSQAAAQLLVEARQGVGR